MTLWIVLVMHYPIVEHHGAASRVISSCHSLPQEPIKQRPRAVQARNCGAAKTVHERLASGSCPIDRPYFDGFTLATEAALECAKRLLACLNQSEYGLLKVLLEVQFGF